MPKTVITITVVVEGQSELRIDTTSHEEVPAPEASAPATVRSAADLRNAFSHNPKELAEAIQSQYGGRRLTSRELEVAIEVADGKGNRVISQLLSLQEQSVKNLVSAIMRKLNCENRTQIAIKINRLQLSD